MGKKTGNSENESHGCCSHYQGHQLSFIKKFKNQKTNYYLFFGGKENSVQKFGKINICLI